MIGSATLLIELRTEELPPKGLKRLSEAFAERVAAGLREREFLDVHSKTTTFATPRRLAVTITHVRAVAPDRPFKEKLLPVSVAFDAAGKPTPALLGKLRARQLAHVDLAALQREYDGKAEVLYYADIAHGGPLVSALQSALDDAIAKLPIAKVMSYPGPGAYYNDQKFVRPARGLAALHGGEIIPVRALGFDAGRVTVGHRFLARAELNIENADAYEPALEAHGRVIPSFGKRRAEIISALERASAGESVIMPDELLDEVTALVEWPKVYTGGFDTAFLAVPQECLILTMQKNQRYFALADSRGKLQNRFLMVSNTEVRDPAAVIHGNERVLRARLADATFFYDQDRKQPLVVRAEKLRSIVYQNKLGTQAERVDRLRMLAKAIAPKIGADPGLADRAGQLAKADLVTDMVAEFPELQGLMGRYYAIHDGENAAVADAIEQHYWPRYSGDALPRAPVATAVALADKLEALAGMFGIGNIPTGDKDPFGLRRAGIGVLRIVMEKRLPLGLSQLIALAFKAFDGVPAFIASPAELSAFMYERMRAYLREQGYSANQVEAVLCLRPDRIDLVPAQMQAIRTFAALPEAEALASANKRIGNILRKSESEAAAAVDRALLGEGAESDLYKTVQKLMPVVSAHVERGDYTAALRELASARSSVDRFFDDVMVMADDPLIRANRLALLRGLSSAMNQVADISKLAV